MLFLIRLEQLDLDRSFTPDRWHSLCELFVTSFVSVLLNGEETGAV